MNARVFLLILVTGSFMAIWNSDHEAMKAALAKRQKNSQTQVALHAADEDLQKTSAELFTHDEAEWQAYLESDQAVEVDAQDLQHASEVEVIELHPESAEQHVITAVPAFEPQIQAVAPEDFRLDVPVEEPSFTAAPSSEFELRHLAVHMVSPVLASIEDAIDEHENVAAEVEHAAETHDETADEHHESSSDETTAKHETGEDHGTNVDAHSTHSAESKAEHSEHESQSEEVAMTAVAVEEEPSAVHEPESGNAPAVAADAEESKSIMPVLPVEGPTIPLPANLANGTWQVVDAAGRSFKITIDRTPLKNADAKEADETVVAELEEHFCIRTSTTGERWCFIRSYETASPAKRVATEFFSPGQTTPGRQ